VPAPRAFKTNESFLEKIAIGATGTRRAFADLERQGHDPLELERGSMSFKIWKAIKIKRVRVPDILCLNCGRRVESRAKTKLEITMSHSQSVQERGWDFGLDDDDRIALIHCTRVGPEPWIGGLVRSSSTSRSHPCDKPSESAWPVRSGQRELRKDSRSE
jgi:hypothetical protein